MDGLRYGIGLWQGVGVRRMAELASVAESVGLDHVWVSNHKLYADMFVAMAAVVSATTRIGVGSFVAEPYAQHPALVAAAIAALDELSGGRVILGLGAGGANFRELGIRMERPAVAIREAVEVIRPLLAGRTVDLVGETTVARGVSLHGLSPRPDIPIIVASRGDRVLQAAGAVADGAMIATYATPEGLRHGRDMVLAGLATAGRSPDGFGWATRVDVALTDDPVAARDAVRPMIAAMVMASYPDTAFLGHAGLELTPELAAMAARKEEALAFASGHLVPDAYVEQYAWTGTPAQVATRIAAVADAGFRDIVVLLQPMSVDPEPAIRRFALEVVPRVRALRG
ncbi:MAG: LLM class flavin-dependent oxidoreductase [Chloroflexi bacterium]|nr:LLM class flavin-dependent oxidoreductase [Chloroflexota bacterium]